MSALDASTNSAFHRGMGARGPPSSPALCCMTKDRPRSRERTREHAEIPRVAPRRRWRPRSLRRG